MAYAKIKSAINYTASCLTVATVTTLVLGAVGGALYAVVRIVRAAWGL